MEETFCFQQKSGKNFSICAEKVISFMLYAGQSFKGDIYLIGNCKQVSALYHV